MEQHHELTVDLIPLPNSASNSSTLTWPFGCQPSNTANAWARKSRSMRPFRKPQASKRPISDVLRGTGDFAAVPLHPIASWQNG